MGAPDLPRELWRVVFDQGYGWPRCTKRRRTQRTYPTARAAARMVATIERLPSHHRLVAVYRTDTAWEPVERDALPEPDPAPEHDPEGDPA